MMDPMVTKFILGLLAGSVVLYLLAFIYVRIYND